MCVPPSWPYAPLRPKRMTRHFDSQVVLLFGPTHQPVHRNDISGRTRDDISSCTRTLAPPSVCESPSEQTFGSVTSKTHRRRREKGNQDCAEVLLTTRSSVISELVHVPAPSGPTTRPAGHGRVLLTATRSFELAEEEEDGEAGRRACASCGAIHQPGCPFWPF
jgi:hypothetical protein